MIEAFHLLLALLVIIAAGLFGLVVSTLGIDLYQSIKEGLKKNASKEKVTSTNKKSKANKGTDTKKVRGKVGLGTRRTGTTKGKRD